MLLFGGSLLTLMAPLASIEFLGSSLTFMMVYVWGRRHPYVTLSFLGIFTFTAPYLPWVLLGFSLMLGSSPKVDLLGMVAGAWGLGWCWAWWQVCGMFECWCVVWQQLSASDPTTSDSLIGRRLFAGVCTGHSRR